MQPNSLTIEPATCDHYIYLSNIIVRNTAFLGVHNLQTGQQTVYINKPKINSHGHRNLFLCQPNQHPLTYSVSFKINSMKTLVNIACHLSSSYFFFDQEINLLQNFFTSYGYPAFIFNTVCKKFLDKFYAPPTIPPVTVSKIQLSFSVPYYSTESEQLIQNLTNRPSVFYLQMSFLVVNKNNISIGKSFRFKGGVSACAQSSIIYKLAWGPLMPPTWACITNVCVRQKHSVSR